jgi:hypothetical protein
MPHGRQVVKKQLLVPGFEPATSATSLVCKHHRQIFYSAPMLVTVFNQLDVQLSFPLTCATLLHTFCSPTQLINIPIRPQSSTPTQMPPHPSTQSASPVPADKDEFNQEAIGFVKANTYHVAHSKPDPVQYQCNGKARDEEGWRRAVRKWAPDYAEVHVRINRALHIICQG